MQIWNLTKIIVIVIPFNGLINFLQFVNYIVINCRNEFITIYFPAICHSVSIRADVMLLDDITKISRTT